MSRTVFLLTALFGVAGCSAVSPTDPAEGVGSVVAHLTLTAQDRNALPCCVTDSANVQITIIDGALTFRGPADYRDTVFTPGGPMSRACVHEVPNGASVNTFTHLVTRSDGTSYLQLPCDRGTYTLVVVRRLDHASGSSATDSVTVSSGTFTAKPDTVNLADSANTSAFTASVTGATILVTAPAHQYRFDPGP
ncbi:MAG TPA: hypothetical protein VGQ48_10095 [Gemmatimonadales bacterium]|nr:hypothetical protein [Gemmatimonadales bacterium]